MRSAFEMTREERLFPLLPLKQLEEGLFAWEKLGDVVLLLVLLLTDMTF